MKQWLRAMCLLGVLASRARAQAPLLQRVADIPMPDGAVRFDYQSLDTASHRLYISHMDADRVVVFDVKARRVVGNVSGVPGSTGVLVVPELGRAFASASRAGHVIAIDMGTLRVVGRMPGGRFPDGIAYAPAERRLFISDESGGADVVLDPIAGRQLTAIPLGGGVGNTQYDPVSGRIFATVGDRNQLAAIDPKSLRVVGQYSLPGGEHPHGLYIDSSRRRAFIACERNARLLVVDMRSMRVTASFPVGEGPDVLAFDPGLGRLYVACESGAVSVFIADDAGVVKLGDLFVAREAHTVAVDPHTHLVYIPLENVGGRPALRIMRPGRGRMRPMRPH